MGLNMCKMGLNTLPRNGRVETHFGGVETHSGVSTHPQTGGETQTKGSQAHYHRENEQTHINTGGKKNANPLNKMSLRFTGRSTVSCVMWYCPQHDNTMTMLTLNTRTR